MKKCEKCGALNFDAAIVCDSCGKQLSQNDDAVVAPVSKQETDKGFEGCQRTEKEDENVKHMKILWPTGGGVVADKDFRFTLHEKATSFYAIHVAVLWILALMVGFVFGVPMFSQGKTLEGVLISVGCLVGLLANIFVARIIYELVMLFSEQLRTMRQIRDLLVQKTNND